MDRFVVLPTRASAVPEGIERRSATVTYVEDWFTHEAFEDAYHVLETFAEDISDSGLPWHRDGISFARIVSARLYSQEFGDFKHLYPFLRSLTTELNEDHDSVTLVWPQEDAYTRAANGLAAELGVDDSFSIHFDEASTHPTPMKSYTDAGPPNVSVWWCFLRIWLIHLLLLAGRVLPGQTDPTDKHIIYAIPANREITHGLVASESVVVSSLRPRLLEPLRTLAMGRLFALYQAFTSCLYPSQLYAEDVLRITVPEFGVLSRTLYALLGSREELAIKLESHLRRECDVPYLPTSYVEGVFGAPFTSTSFLKTYVYLLLFDPRRAPRSITSVTDGITRASLTELGSKHDIPVIDLDHTVLRYEPGDVYNHADIKIVKGKPEMEWLQRRNLEKRLVLTGRPYFDELYWRIEAEKTQNPEAVPEQMGEWNSTLLVATEPIRGAHIERLLEKAFESDVDGVCVKLHPRESKDRYESILDDLDPETPYVIITQEYELFDLIEASDVVVTVSSNVGLEALIFGIPAVHVSLPANIRLYYQTIEFFSEFVVQPAELPRRVNTFRREGIDGQTVKEIREIYLVDGQATDRLVAELYRDSN